MTYEELQNNWKTFLNTIQQIPVNGNENLQKMFNLYIEHNFSILNDILSLSIDHLKKLPEINTVNNIICHQAKLIHAINKKLTQGTEHFLDATMIDIGDYNEWLKNHCDFATD